MEKYDKAFLDFMKTKYRITPTNQEREVQIITFAVAWNVWKQAKKVYGRPK